MTFTDETKELACCLGSVVGQDDDVQDAVERLTKQLLYRPGGDHAFNALLRNVKMLLDRLSLNEEFGTLLQASVKQDIGEYEIEGKRILALLAALVYLRQFDREAVFA